jgi:GNAT superfamily N-acetyltransferase
MPLALEIRRLSQQDRCADFASGHERLDEFFRRYAKQHEARQTSATFVARAAETIVGFATIAPMSIPSAPLKGHVKNLSSFPAPVLLLARMATDARFHRRGVGARILREVVLARAVTLADGFGCVGIYVDPKPDAVAFYAKHDFTALPIDAAPPPMFLPMGTIRRAMDGT